MTAFKIVIGTKKGKCLQKELSEDESSSFIGKKIGEKIAGETIGFAGYEFEITGGSDSCGFPMRKDIDGPIRKRIFAVQGVGLKKKGKGIKVRKTVCGNAVHAKISQINLKILKEGKEKLIEEKKEEPKKAEKPAEKPKETVKEEPKKEAPKEEKPKEEPKKAEKPAEKPKEAEKKEEKPSEETKK